jgi:hypothetical protein
MVDEPDTASTLEGNVKPVLEVETTSNAKSPTPDLQDPLDGTTKRHIRRCGHGKKWTLH